MGKIIDCGPARAMIKLLAATLLLGPVGCEAHRAEAPPATTAAPSPSPRIASLAIALAASTPGAEEAFWREVQSTGAPLVEDVGDASHPLVTFVWRGTSTTQKVEAMIGLPLEQSRLTRVAGSNVFALSVPLPDTTRLTYSFVVDGEVLPDLLSKHLHGPAESILTLPRAPAQPFVVASRAATAGTLWRHGLRSSSGERERALFVYTPPGFSADGPAYPLLIAFDAEAVTSQQPLPLILDELIAAKRIPPVVALLIGNVNRARDLAPNPAFEDLVALDLVPWVRRQYHATSDPLRTVISGSSRGGLAAASAARRHPEVYGNVLSQSGAFWWAPGFVPSPTNTLGSPDGAEPESLARDFAVAPKLPLRFWMEAGAFEAGQRAASRHLRTVLLARGYEVTYLEFAGNHSYASWRGTIADGLVALFGAAPRLAAAPVWPATARAPLDLTPATRSSLSWLVRAALLDGGEAAVAAAKPLLAKNPEGYALDEGELAAAGEALLTLGHAREAIPLLRWSTERFPSSAGTWEALAWAHLGAGDRAEALANFRRALVLDVENSTVLAMVAALSAPSP